MSRRFQLSLRQLLVVTAIIAGPCAWVAYNANIVRQRKAMEPEFLFLGNSLLRLGGRLSRKGRELSLPWLRRALGDEPIETLWYMADRDADGSELRCVRKLFPETEIREMPE